MAEGERVPIVAVAPQFPRRALENGISGWVMIRFDVDPMGLVQNATVIDAEPGTLFNRNALKAISKFRYKPTVVDGQSVWSRSNFYRMRFDIVE